MANKGAAKSLLVVAGPSGVGKGTLVKMLTQRLAPHLGFSISSTSRLPRPGEVDGREYDFVDKQTFLDAIRQGKFAEHAVVHDHLYGTSISRVKEVTDSGRVCVLEIDVQGVRQVQHSHYHTAALYVFITPPDLKTLESRLRGRGTEDEAQLATRLHAASTELERAAELSFDKVVVNDTLSEALEELVKYVEAGFEGLIKGREEQGGEVAENNGGE